MYKLITCLPGCYLLVACSTPFPGEPHSAVSQYPSVGSFEHSHAEMVHSHSVNATGPEHFHPYKRWEETRTVAEEKKRRLRKERERRVRSMMTRPRGY